MCTGVAKVMQQTDPRKVRIQYEKGKRRWCDLWGGNPRIAAHDEVGDFQILEPRSNYLRPYCSAKTQERWTWLPYRPPVGEIYFRAFENAFGQLHGGTVVVEPDVKAGASPNKQWGNDRWQRFAVLAHARGVKLTQIGRTQGNLLPGARFVQTNIREAAALVAHSRAVVTGEGALHHIAAAVGTPAVVIYGGYIGPNVTGYDGQASLFTGGGLGCGMRIRCKHCDEAMAKITPEMVFGKLMDVIHG